MSVIEIKRDWGTINRPKISRFLTKRYYGLWPGITIWGIALLVLVAGILTVDYLLPHRFQQRNWLAAMAPMYFALLAMAILNSVWKKRIFHDLNEAPVRSSNRSVFLSEHGVSDFGPPQKQGMTWDYITDVVPYNNLVLLLLSPVEYIPLQMDSLPDEMTREALLEQIAKWRGVSWPDK